MNILEARRRTLGGHILKKTAQGNPAIATDSLARRGPGITMQGWTEQDGTPTPESPVPIVNSGTQNQDTGKWEYEVEVGCGNLFNKGTANENKYIDNNSGLEYDGSGTYASDYIKVFGFDNIRCTNTGSSQWMAFYNHEKICISGKNGYGEAIPVPQNAMYARFTIINGFINTFSVNAGITLLPYTPYRPPQTVTLTADRPLTKWDRLEKRGGQWGWVYKSEEIESYTDESVPGEYFSTTGQLSTGAQVWYETTTETFVSLTTAEQEAMNALYTYRPTTVLSNQQDCEMALTYKTRKTMEVTA